LLDSIIEQIRLGIFEKYQEYFQSPPILLKGKLRCIFIDGGLLDIHYPQIDEYSFHFMRQSIIERVDTSPYHPNIGTFPNHHHHLEENNIQEDKISIFEGDPLENAINFLKIIIQSYYEETS
jgi:hypothetical protein